MRLCLYIRHGFTIWNSILCLPYYDSFLNYYFFDFNSLTTLLFKTCCCPKIKRLSSFQIVVHHSWSKLFITVCRAKVWIVNDTITRERLDKFVHVIQATILLLLLLLELIAPGKKVIARNLSLSPPPFLRRHVSLFLSLSLPLSLSF